MALPVLQNPGSPAVVPDSPTDFKRPNPTKRRLAAATAAADDGRRPATAVAIAAAAARRQTGTLRRVKDSTEELRRARSRTIETATSITSASTVSASAGRSFTVANVNNGILYLRPIVRPGNQRARPTLDPFVFPPQTPPDSATLDSNTLRPPSNDWRESFTGSHTPPPAGPSPPLPGEVNAEKEIHKLPSPPPQRSIPHVRSRSFSTADEHTSQTVEPGTFKVVIERPATRRPKTADTSIPILKVPIPHYRLGTPRFSARGTAILRSSVYTRASGTDDLRSSIFNPGRATHSFLSSRRRSEVYSPPSIDYRLTLDKMTTQPSTPPSPARISKVEIGPHLYDALTRNPDDESVVRFSASGDIIAAIPSRLIAHITSPSFLDYELLSDFFLTFRSFLTSKDLVAYLISRLHWAVDRQDDFGRIVRVRTFVALRHWILNYFVDDFVPSYHLRTFFCELVNRLYGDLKARADGGGGDIKIVGELKKCWRRTCALYWDIGGVEFDSSDSDLLPGGQVGSQASVEEEYQMPVTPPRSDGSRPKLENFGSNPSDQFTSKHMEWAQRSHHTPQNSINSPYIPSQDNDGTSAPLSPASTISVQVVSCSIPMRGLNKAEGNAEIPLYPHPVPHPTRFIATPQYSVSINRPNRPSHSHKRSGSFSDALRDNRGPLSNPKTSVANAASSPVVNAPGSLVHGGIFQPGSPYIDVKNGSLRHTKSHIDLEHVHIPATAQSHSPHSPNPGMKKLLGSVRRALSSKQPSNSTAFLPSTHQTQLAQSARSMNSGSVSTAHSGVHKRRYPRAHSQVRIDLLALRVEESFKTAINQELRNENQRHDSPPGLSAFDFEFSNRASPLSDDRLRVQEEADPRIYSNVTTGSRSIVIMDDTGPPPLPFMSGALPVPEDAIDVKDDLIKEPTEQKEQIIHPHEDDTAVENPGLPVDTTNTRRSELYEEPKPKESMDWYRTSWGSIEPSVTRRRSMSETRQQRMHSIRRRGSTKTSAAYSMSLRRHASYNSGLSRRNNAVSIATTFRTMSSDNDPFSLEERPVGPTRQLRRRPGGDLRAVDNVHDLETLQRPHSTGSVSNRTHSIANSIILYPDKYVESSAKEESEEPTPPPRKKSISLVATHSSQPNLRPSFEAEVAKLAALPDDTDDDGGIESALMKLEGRYEKRTPDPSPRATMAPETYKPTGTPEQLVKPSTPPPAQEASRPETQYTLDDVLSPPLEHEAGRDIYQHPNEVFARRDGPPVASITESEDSYSSIPLLDRGLSDITTTKRSQIFDSMRSSNKPAPLNTSPQHIRNQSVSKLASPGSSIEYVVETESMKRIPRGGTHPRVSAARESFLLDADEDLSDMADDDSAIAARSEGTSHGVRSFFDDEPAVLDPEKTGLPMHIMRHPPTPPLTANPVTRLNDPLPPVDTTVFQRGLPTPGLTPTSRFNGQPFNQTKQTMEPVIELQELKKKDTSQSTSHIPFILAYDSETLAQQMTLIEKDALDEIDWKELIELRWKQSSPQIRDWVHYLRTQPARGVDVVIARFNLVVKWAASEILLTESIEERARCIVKYIHIAAHARRLRNYATMYQITIALLSVDVARLKRTWALVPAQELLVVRELEVLVQPLRNFHHLRVEMETSSLEEGCIPFIGIYTRDLIYNAQKPSFLPVPPVAGERMVNFERHHTAAMIVKSLLRLLEASGKYHFSPQPDVISKCLWLAALGDDEITEMSRKCEADVATGKAGR